MKKKKIIVIVGPTASGKTALSIEIAKKYNGEIISADSRQVYRGLDIGTEKITREEMAGIPHHLIDCVDVDTVYSATRFREDAEKAIADITASGHLPIIAGGTGFYIDMLLGKTGAVEVPPNPPLRTKLEAKGAEELFLELTKKDPERAQSIDQHNKRRLIRALEIVEAIGSVPVTTTKDASYDALVIGIKTNPDILNERIERRVRHALKRGLVEETKTLLEGGVSKDRLSEIGHEYREVLSYLDGEINENELLTRCIEKNKQYAKRQLTWFKRDESIQWFEMNETEAVLQRVQDFIGT